MGIRGLILRTEAREIATACIASVALGSQADFPQGPPRWAVVGEAPSGQFRVAAAGTVRMPPEPPRLVRPAMVAPAAA